MQNSPKGTTGIVQASQGIFKTRFRDLSIVPTDFAIGACRRHPACPGLPWGRSASQIYRMQKGLSRGVKESVLSLPKKPRRRVLADAVRSFPPQTVRKIKKSLRSVEKHFHEGSVEPRVPPLRSPGFPVELVGFGEPRAPFFTEGAYVDVGSSEWPEIRVRSGRDDKGESRSSTRDSLLMERTADPLRFASIGMTKERATAH